MASWYLNFNMRFLWGILVFCCLLTGCGRRGVRRLLQVPRTAFTAQNSIDQLRVQGRICTYKELQGYFSSPHDLYHYYHLLHIRVENQSYVRYTLQADKCSFFVPEAETLRKYTRSNRSGYGAAVSFFNAVLFFPVYVISMLKAAVESPPYLLNSDLVVPKPFGFLSAMYGAVSLGPFVLGTVAERSASDKYFAEAKEVILTQRQQLSIPPYKSIDTLILTPRAGFSLPCTVAFYNHKLHELEPVELALRAVW